VREGRPWHAWKEKIEESLDDYAFSTQFGWTDEQIEDMRENRPDKYQQYKAIMAGVASVKTQENG